MAHVFLCLSQADAPSEEMRREGMPERVRRDALLEPQPLPRRLVAQVFPPRAVPAACGCQHLVARFDRDGAELARFGVRILAIAPSEIAWRSDSPPGEPWRRRAAISRRHESSRRSAEPESIRLGAAAVACGAPEFLRRWGFKKHRWFRSHSPRPIRSVWGTSFT
jgi:hypothetical protein